MQIFPMTVRGKAMALVVFVNRFMSGVIALSYESIVNYITPGVSFYLFAVLSAISVWFYWSKVPETRGKPLEDITTELTSFAPPQCCPAGGRVRGGIGNSINNGGHRHHQVPDDECDD
ncbi:unnamed protein product [Choristocarpus tenellus]